MGIFSKIGDLFNDITGTTSAAKLQNKYQKEFAQNAHQWEVADLKKAGLNPILSAGGSGATAGGAGGTTGSSGVNPIDTGMNLINTIASAKKLNADSALANAQTLNTDVQSQIGMIDMMVKQGRSKAEINKAYAELENTIQQTKKIRAEIPVLNANAKQLKGGRISKELGTWVNDVASNVTNNLKNHPRMEKIQSGLRNMGLIR